MNSYLIRNYQIVLLKRKVLWIVSTSSHQLWSDTYIIKKKLYGSFLWMGFNCLKATEPLRRDSLLFTTKFPEVSSTHLINLGYMKGLVNIRVTVLLTSVPNSDNITRNICDAYILGAAPKFWDYILKELGKVQASHCFAKVLCQRTWDPYRSKASIAPAIARYLRPENS